MQTVNVENICLTVLIIILILLTGGTPDLLDSIIHRVGQCN